MCNLTDEEIEAEWKYKVDERLGIMCEGKFCTPDQRRRAIEHADWWKYAALGFRECVRSDDTDGVRINHVHLPDASIASPRHH